jgi:hypothetical protein
LGGGEVGAVGEVDGGRGGREEGCCGCAHSVSVGLFLLLMRLWLEDAVLTVLVGDGGVYIPWLYWCCS